MANLATELEARPTESVLVVDDEPCVRGLLVRWLRAAGYACVEAGTAEDAWRALDRHPQPLVTLDITLPGRSGLDLLLQIKAALPDTEVIMLTALGQTETAITALTRGASAYLIKPVAREELLFQVRQSLERRQMRIEKRLYTERLEERVREQTHSIRQAHEETIQRLVMASMYRDKETGAHIRRVGMFSALMAESLGWPCDDVERIRMAAPMHDIGKIGIPDAVLQKPGPLTTEEFEIMKTHTTIGGEMLTGSDSQILDWGRIIALTHHEHWDGRGYPNGLRGDAIPEAGRIVAIVDVYDALSHDRVYRLALAEDEVIALLEKGCGTHFDPALLRLFLSLLPEVRRIAGESPDEISQFQAAREHKHPWDSDSDVTASVTMLQAT